MKWRVLVLVLAAAAFAWDAGGPLARGFDRLSVPSRMHGDPDMGLHGQIFLDRIALEACAGRGVAV